MERSDQSPPLAKGDLEGMSIFWHIATILRDKEKPPEMEGFTDTESSQIVTYQSIPKILCFYVFILGRVL